MKPSKRVCRKSCLWEWEDDGYYTNCLTFFRLELKRKRTAHFKYCPFCGKRIKEVRV
jgi:hypothetical protein